MLKICYPLIQLAIILSLLLRQSHQACTTTQSPFPKFLGGTQGATYFLSIDYNQGNGYLVAAGSTRDQGVRGDSLGNVFRPIIIAYSSVYYSYAWGKVFTSLVNEQFYGVKINQLGTKLVACNQAVQRYMIVVDITNGNLISAKSFTALFTYGQNYRCLLLLDNDSILFGDDKRLLNMVSGSTDITAYTMTSFTIIALQFSKEYNRLYVFQFSAISCMITVLNLESFTRVYQYQTQCTAGTVFGMAQTLQSCDYQSSSKIQTMVTQMGTRFSRIKNYYSNDTLAISTVHDPSVSSLQGRGLFCVSSYLVFSLMWGTYLTDASRLIVAEVNFNLNKIIYTRFLQRTNSNVYHGVIFAGNKFFIAGYVSTSIYKTASSTFNTQSPSYHHGSINTPMLTCISIDQFQYPVVTLIANGYTLTATTYDYTASQLTIADITSTLAAPNNIVLTQFEGLFQTQCSSQLPIAPHDYSALSSSQAINQLYYALDDFSPKTITITPFTANKISPTAADPVFTYNLDSFIGPFSGATFTPSTRQILIPSLAALGEGTYTIIIEGKLQDCQMITATIKLISNTPPLLIGVLGFSLPEVHAEQGQITNYPLPNIFDPDIGQTITATLVEIQGSAFLSFVDFKDSSNTTIQIEPTIKAKIGFHQIELTLNDGVETTTYTLNINVSAHVINKYAQTNQGPPYYNESLEPVTLYVGNQIFEYALPQIVDPDDDLTSMRIDLREANLFSYYDKAAQQIVFNPVKGKNYKEEYQIMIVLTDKNIKPKKNTYKLSIYINQTHEIELAKNHTQVETLEDIQLANPQLKTYKTSIKIVEVSRNGEVQLQIISSLSSMAKIITAMLNDTDIQVLDEGKQQEIRSKINDVLQGNILKIKMDFQNQNHITTGMVSLKSITWIGFKLCQSKNPERFRLCHWKCICISPEGINCLCSNSNSILIKRRKHRELPKGL
ncbi:hypothetical protein FGO68_gene13578 [Halteria grandinella]|uniref:Cadherin-like beta sandwich domain-containing protein n=1 Tax=Halteria grandinella TaxID=5974 RepID=A0A8J8P1X3_HALGN|nr:hypothetical protein FGO68_gene13578 [Halteria grandinella]